MPIELSTEEVVLGGGAGEEISLASVMSKLTNIINRRLPSCTNVYSAAQRTLAEMYGQQTWAVPYALLAPLAASVLLESGQSSNVVGNVSHLISFLASFADWSAVPRQSAYLGQGYEESWEAYKARVEREDAEWCNEVRPVHERHVAAILSKFGTVVLTSAGGLPVAEAILVGSIVEEAMRTTSESAVDSAKAAFRASWENILSTVDSWANEQLKRDQASEQDTGSDEVVATSAPDEVVATQLLDA